MICKGARFWITAVMLRAISTRKKIEHDAGPLLLLVSYKYASQRSSSSRRDDDDEAAKKVS